MVESISFKITNRCRSTIWPGFLSGANSTTLPTTGFSLSRGKSKTVEIPTVPGHEPFVHKIGAGKVECSGAGAKPPATLAEFTLNGTGGLDFYDVSLVDGYNLPPPYTR